MREQWSVPAWVVLTPVVALVLLLAVVVLVVARGRAAQLAAQSAARDETAALRAQVEAIQRRLGAPDAAVARAEPAPEPEYVITHLGEEPDPAPAVPAPAVRAPVFADIVLRESVVQAASLAHGVRRALTPENRNRIRFEVRRATKRARKQRRAEDRAAARLQRRGGAAPHGRGSAA